MLVKHSSILTYKGGNFIREYTTLKLENGQPANNTMLDRDHAPFQALVNKKSFHGCVTLFGQELDVYYSPRINDSGDLIGALMVAL